MGKVIDFRMYMCKVDGELREIEEYLVDLTDGLGDRESLEVAVNALDSEGLRRYEQLLKRFDTLTGWASEDERIGKARRLSEVV